MYILVIKCTSFTRMGDKSGSTCMQHKGTCEKEEDGDKQVCDRTELTENGFATLSLTQKDG